MSLRIKFRSASLDQFIERYGVDVSRGGIFIRTREPLAVGTSLKFDFQLQDMAPLLAGEGTVVWIRENDPTRAGVTPGMGVRFDKLTVASQPVLEKILAEKGRREQAGAPAKANPSGGMAVRRPSSMFSALDPAAARAAQLPVASGPPRMGGLSPLGAGPPPHPPASPTAASPLASPPAGRPLSVGAAPPAAQSPTGSGPLESKIRTTENPVPAGIPTLESSGAFGRPRSTTGMNAQRPVPAPSALFEKPTADDIDRALAVLTEVDGPPSAPVAVPVDFSSRTRRPTDAQPMVLESSADVGDASSRRAGTGTKPLFSSTSERRAATVPVVERQAATVPVVPIGGPAPELLDDAQDVEDEEGATSAWLASGPTRVGGTEPDMEAVKESGDALAKALAPPPQARGEEPSLRRGATPGMPLATAPAAVKMPPPFHSAAPAKRSVAPALIAGLLVLGGAVAGFFIFSKGGSKTDVATTTAVVPAPTAPAPEGTAAANPENAAAPAPSGVPVAPAPGGATEQAAADKATAEAKPAGGTATPLTLRPRAPEPIKEAPQAEVKPAEPKPALDHPAHKGMKRKGSGAAAAPAVAAPAVADVSPKPVGDAPAAPTGDSAAAKEPKSSSALKITTTPAGAEVIIDGNSVGKTPFLTSDVDPAAPHAITLKKDGFEAHEHMISGSDWPRPHNGVRTLKVNVKLHSSGGGEAAKPAESGEAAPSEPPPGLGTTPASPKRE